MLSAEDLQQRGLTRAVGAEQQAAAAGLSFRSIFLMSGSVPTIGEPSMLGYDQSRSFTATPHSETGVSTIGSASALAGAASVETVTSEVPAAAPPPPSPPCASRGGEGTGGLHHRGGGVHASARFTLPARDRDRDRHVFAFEGECRGCRADVSSRARVLVARVDVDGDGKSAKKRAAVAARDVETCERIANLHPDGEKRLSKTWVEEGRVGFGVAPSTGALIGY